MSGQSQIQILSYVSDPSGNKINVKGATVFVAKVYVNGDGNFVNYGVTTPCIVSVTCDPSGGYMNGIVGAKVRLEHPEYGVGESEEIYTGGCPHDVINTYIQLKPVPRPSTYGSISVTSAVAGNSSVSSFVYIDGTYTQYKTPCTIPNILVGTHIVKIQKPYYTPVEQSVEVTSGNVTPVSVFLLREPVGSGYGTLNITSTPGGATIFLDDEKLPDLTPLTILVNPGRHLVELKLNGYNDYSTEVDVGVNGSGSVGPTLVGNGSGTSNQTVYVNVVGSSGDTGYAYTFDGDASRMYTLPFTTVSLSPSTIENPHHTIEVYDSPSETTPLTECEFTLSPKTGTGNNRVKILNVVVD